MSDAFFADVERFFNLLDLDGNQFIDRHEVSKTHSYACTHIHTGAHMHTCTHVHIHGHIPSLAAHLSLRTYLYM